MTLLIRSASPADAGLVHALIRELAEYEKLLDQVVATEADTAAALFADHPRVFCDIAEWGGAAAGLALWFYNFSTFRGAHGIYLEDLFVRPAFRRHGLGRALLDALQARTDGRVEWSVLDWNTPAHDFYRTLGAHPMEEWTVWRWPPVSSA